MGQCLSNIFTRKPSSSSPPGAPASANAPKESNAGRPPANVPDEVFHEHGRPQNQYDQYGARVFPGSEQHRKEANHQASIRTSKHEESRRAYQAGQKANAHELSLEGKRHGCLMEEANQRAAQSILLPQNSDHTGVIDLHGLFVKEAEEAARDFLMMQQRAKRFREVEVITGAGHHSKGHNPKIRPAIEHLISGLDLPYHHPRRNDGAFVVELSANQ